MLPVFGLLITPFATNAEPVDQCRSDLVPAVISAQPDPDDTSVGTSKNISRIELFADQASVDINGVSVLEGDVQVEYGDRHIRADRASYDARTRKVEVAGSVALDSNNLRIDGGQATFSSEQRSGSFSDARFVMLDRNGRGNAKSIEVLGDNQLILKDVRYTACPEGENDWQFIAPEIVIDRDKQVGTGKNVRVEFKGIPILYAPLMSFPVGDQRKSGVLLPDFSNNDSSGTDIALPYYWNIAPNYDSLITLRYLSKRGVQLGTASRYLFAHSSGELQTQFLSNDTLTGEDRVYGKMHHTSHFPNGFNIAVDAEDVSDGNYYEDLNSSLAGASITHLERRVDLYHESRYWTAGIRGQAFRTLDDTITDLNEPYKRLPQVWLTGAAGGPNQINLGLASDLTNFERDDGARGLRANIEPSVSFPISGSAYLIEPKVSVTHTQYDLKELSFVSQDADLSRTVPTYSLDGRLFFERQSRASGNLRQTLEPRIRYTHIPYVEQQNFPVFDTGNPDINLIQLFRDNRYSGYDRIGDTDQLSVGLTTRLLNTSNGRELVTATLGQAVYFGSRSVRLPGEQILGDSSNIIADIGLGFSQRWNADLEYQWAPDQSSTAKAAIRVQYQPAPDKVINLAYRFQNNDLEQSDLSFAWPIGDNWNVVGRWNYSLDERKTLERFAGVEYNRCCWSVRLVSRRFVNNRSGGEDSALFAQIELKGLTSIGARVDAFLERGILGYGQERN